jgi:hypothetical protein
LASGCLCSKEGAREVGWNGVVKEGGFESSSISLEWSGPPKEGGYGLQELGKLAHAGMLTNTSRRPNAATVSAQNLACLGLRDVAGYCEESGLVCACLDLVYVFAQRLEQGVFLGVTKMADGDFGSMAQVF